MRSVADVRFEMSLRCLLEKTVVNGSANLCQLHLPVIKWYATIMGKASVLNWLKNQLQEHLAEGFELFLMNLPYLPEQLTAVLECYYRQHINNSNNWQRWNTFLLFVQMHCIEKDLYIIDSYDSFEGVGVDVDTDMMAETILKKSIVDAGTDIWGKEADTYILKKENQPLKQCAIEPQDFELCKKLLKTLMSCGDISGEFYVKRQLLSNLYRYVDANKQVHSFIAQAVPAGLVGLLQLYKKVEAVNKHVIQKEAKHDPTDLIKKKLPCYRRANENHGR